MTEAIEVGMRRWLDEFVPGYLQPEELVALATRLNDTIETLMPHLADDEIRRDLKASTIAQLRSFLVGLSNDTTPTQPPAEARALARTLARRGFDLRVLMQLYRAGQHAGNNFLMERVAAAGLPLELERALIRRLFDRTTELLGNSLDQLVDTYTQEREIGVESAMMRRAETVRTILNGGEFEPETASRQLGYRLSGKHIGCVLWSEVNVGESDVAGILERVAIRIATALAGVRPLTIPSGAHGLWAWIPVNTAPDLRRLPMTEEAGVRMAFGAFGTGISGFRRTHVEALAARQVAQRRPSTEWLTNYLDVELLHLMSADADGMRALVARELAGIDGPDPSSVRLRETLAAYLDHHCSTNATAQALGVHKNTVRYRIQRIEELLGHSIDSRRLQIEVALQLSP